MRIERIKELRVNNKLSQKEVAEILKVSRGTYASWECGSDTIPTRQLYKLAEYYQKSIDYILGLNNQDNKIYINKDIDLNVIGNNLKEIRNSCKLSQDKFAKSININQSTWWAYENGKTLITTNSLIELNKNYGYTVDWILGRKK